MGMGSNDGACATRNVPCNGLFFRSRLAVEFDKHDRRDPLDIGKELIYRAERIVDRIHERAALQYDHSDRTGLRIVYSESAPRRSRRVIMRPENSGFLVQ